jgi:ribosomal protein S4
MARKPRKYKAFSTINEVVRKEVRFLNLKRPKWTRLRRSFPSIFLKRAKYRKIPLYKNQTKLYTPVDWVKIKQTYRSYITAKRKFYNFYNIDLNFKTLKSLSNKTTSIYDFLAKFEHRVDVLLWRLGLVKNPSEARLLILHGKISVNGFIVRTKSLILKKGDFLQIHIPSKMLENQKQRRASLNFRLRRRLYTVPFFVEANFNTNEFFILENPRKESLVYMSTLYSTYLDLIGLKNYFRLN